jgi:hypothetical protein
MLRHCLEDAVINILLTLLRTKKKVVNNKSRWSIKQ